MKWSLMGTGVVIALSLMILGCGQAPDQQASQDQTSSSPEWVKQEDLPDTAPLIGIMIQLEQEMQRASKGLWRHDFKRIQAAADRIANHPKIPKSQVATLQEILGPDRFPAFVQTDKTVHQRSLDLREAAADEDFEATAQSYMKLQQGCVSCHQNFREEIRRSPKW